VRLSSHSISCAKQILLGPCRGVFALLEFRWVGLPVGIAQPSAPCRCGANQRDRNQMGPIEVR